MYSLSITPTFFERSPWSLTYVLIINIQKKIIKIIFLSCPQNYLFTRMKNEMKYKEWVVDKAKRVQNSIKRISHRNFTCAQYPSFISIPHPWTRSFWMKMIKRKGLGINRKNKQKTRKWYLIWYICLLQTKRKGKSSSFLNARQRINTAIIKILCRNGSMQDDHLYEMPCTIPGRSWKHRSHSLHKTTKLIWINQITIDWSDNAAKYSSDVHQLVIVSLIYWTVRQLHQPINRWSQME